MCCMPLNQFSKCFRAAIPKKTQFFAQKWPKSANFLAQPIVFWVQVDSSCPPYPILRVLDLENDVLYVIEPV